MEKKVICKNKKAYFNYFVEDDVEAGIVLLGSEVKSIVEGKIDLVDGYVTIKDNQMILHKVHIQEYRNSSYLNHEPVRNRKLLMHKKEIVKLDRKIKEKGLSLIPLTVYFRNGKIKIKIGICKGKKKYDKREDLKRKEFKREIDRGLKGKF